MIYNQLSKTSRYKNDYCTYKFNITVISFNNVHKKLETKL